MNLTCPVLILAVDDEQDLCVLTKEFLEGSSNIMVDIAGSVSEARAMIAQKHYDVIVSDYQMPHEDGIQFLKSLRASGDTTPFILFTGKGREEVVIEAFENGADAYLQKGGEPRSLFVEMENRIGTIIRRHQAEAALLDSEMEYHVLFENNPDPIILVSSDGKILNTNESGARMVSMSKEVIIGCSISDLGVFSENDVALFQRTIMAMVKGESVKPVVSQVRRKDGTVRWVEIRASVVMKSGRIQAIQIIGRDITNNKQVEEKLRGANRQLCIAMDLAHLAYWEYDEKSDKYTFNDRFYDLCGTNVEREGGYFVSREIYYRDFIHPDDIGFVTEMASKAPNYLSDSLHFSHRIIRRDGEVRFIEVYPCRIKDDDGNIAKIFGVNQDITELRRMEEIQREDEERQREIFNNVNDAIHVHEWNEGNAPGHFIDVNDIACRMLGYSREEMLQLRPLDIATNHHDPPLQKVLETLAATGSAKFETNLRGKDGTLVPVEIHDRLITRQGRKIAIAVVRDITENKRNLNALRIANKKLNLLSSITRHDINNQLTVLQGNLTLFKTKNPEIAGNVLLHKADCSAERISAMIHFTKTYEDIGGQTPTWQEVQVMIEKCGKEVRHEAVRVLNDIPAGTMVFADPLIIRVFCNLMENTVRHGGRLTFIRFYIEERDGNQTIVCEDDGAGISPEMKTKLFTKGVGNDHGFGLFISREILEITGITITEEGAIGEGAKFVITPPRDGIKAA